jgi:uncharacterized coiled-coil DUF342 family protein
MDESIFERLGRVTRERDAAVAKAKIEKTRADGHYENYCEILKRIDVVLNERDEARAEVEQLKQVLHDARLENSGQAAQLERTRPEPSRLDIAAMLLQGMTACSHLWGDPENTALRKADALIKAAREAQ